LTGWAGFKIALAANAACAGCALRLNMEIDIGRTTGPLRLVTDGRTFQPSYQIR
jgi:hypothetical protein